ncbi:MAG: filamentous hemagglutinin N-terminal domain-containing protein [Cyanobacteria bacterium P01_D01_bin.115]
MQLHWLAAAAIGIYGGGLLGADRGWANPIIPEAGSQTQVEQTGNEFTITGGVSSGDGQALFHSFEQLGLSAGQVATFMAQPELQSILGRVVGGDASYINGLLSVSGGADLYLINPAGILFGPHTQLDLAGSFAATTANGVQFDTGIFDAIAANDYAQLTGSPVGYVFTGDEAAAIANAGNLAVSPGEAILLIGGQVINTGTLTAPGGDIVIAAVPEANLVRISHPDMVLNLELATLPEDLATASNAFTPLSLPELLTGGDAAFATGLTVQPDGTVALINTATEIPHGAGTAVASGTLDASGTAGGDITVVGDRVALLDATVNASGANDGGTVRVGGDFQGQDTLPGAQVTYVDGDTEILANAGTVGDGGTVILWADGATAFYGEITAAGGSVAGDGGFVEVSGQETLVYRGTVTAIAPNGQIGTLLLDPTDVTIRNGTVDGDDSDGSAFQLTEFTFAAADAIPTVIYESELESSPGNIDLGIRASNNIVLEDLTDDALTFFTDPANPGSITFEAGNEFRFADSNDAIVAPRRSLTITANTITTGDLNTSDGSAQGGSITLNAAGAITTGDLLSFGDPFAGSGNITVVGGSLTAGRVSAGGGFSDASRVELTATTGDIIVDTISAGNGGLEVDAAQRFQARDTFDTTVRITLDSSTDAELIDFLMRGDPQPLIDAGLVDPADFNDQVFITFPTSIFVSPDGGTGEIVIRHGGQANTFSGDNITITGTGALPDVQFVAGPNNDHTIDIPMARFFGFTTLFPAGTFPSNASGTTGAILRGQGDATLVTSFQNQPFVPVAPEPPGGSPNPGNPGTPAVPIDVIGGGLENVAGDNQPEATTTLENLSDVENEGAAATDAAGEDEPLTTDDSTEPDCQAAIADQSADTVMIAGTCEADTGESGE